MNVRITILTEDVSVLEKLKNAEEISLNKNNKSAEFSDIDWRIPENVYNPFNLLPTKTGWVTPTNLTEFQNKLFNTLVGWQEKQKKTLERLKDINLYGDIGEKNKDLIQDRLNKIDKPVLDENSFPGVPKVIIWIWVSGFCPVQLSNFCPKEFQNNVSSIADLCKSSTLQIIFTNKTKEELNESNDPLLKFCQGKEILLINFKEHLGDGYIFQDFIESAFARGGISTAGGIDMLKPTLLLSLMGGEYFDMDLRVDDEKWNWENEIFLPYNTILPNIIRKKGRLPTQNNDIFLCTPLKQGCSKQDFFSSSQGVYLTNLFKGLFWNKFLKENPTAQVRSNIPLQYKILNEKDYDEFVNSFNDREEKRNVFLLSEKVLGCIQGGYIREGFYDDYSAEQRFTSMKNGILPFLPFLPLSSLDWFLVMRNTSSYNVKVPIENENISSLIVGNIDVFYKAVKNNCANSWLKENKKNINLGDNEKKRIFQQVLHSIVLHLQLNTCDLNYYHKILKNTGLITYLLYTLVFHCKDFEKIEMLYISDKLYQLMLEEERNEQIESWLIENKILSNEELLCEDKSLVPLLEKIKTELFYNKERFKNFNRGPEAIKSFPKHFIDMQEYIAKTTGKKLDALSLSEWLRFAEHCPCKIVKKGIEKRLLQEHLSEEEQEKKLETIKEQFKNLVIMVVNANFMFNEFAEEERVLPDFPYSTLVWDTKITCSNLREISCMASLCVIALKEYEDRVDMDDNFVRFCSQKCSALLLIIDAVVCSGGEDKGRQYNKQIFIKLLQYAVQNFCGAEYLKSFLKDTKKYIKQKYFDQEAKKEYFSKRIGSMQKKLKTAEWNEYFKVIKKYFPDFELNNKLKLDEVPLSINLPQPEKQPEPQEKTQKNESNMPNDLGRNSNIQTNIPVSQFYATTNAKNTPQFNFSSSGVEEKEVNKKASKNQCIIS